MLYTLLFFSSKYSLFRNANLFGTCIIHILYTECAKIKKKNNSGAKVLIPILAITLIVSSAKYILNNAYHSNNDLLNLTV